MRGIFLDIKNNKTMINYHYHIFENGDAIRGHDKQFDGMCQYTFASNGNILEGFCKDGKFIGICTETLANCGTTMTCERSNGNFNGYCVITKTNGDTIEGRMQNNKCHGYWKKTHNSGEVEYGRFKDGKFSVMPVYISIKCPECSQMNCVFTDMSAHIIKTRFTEIYVVCAMKNSQMCFSQNANMSKYATNV